MQEEPHPGGTPLRYMPQLDALRALAVIGVWFEHWGVYGRPGFRWIEWGRLGVWLFFVLSGFLITSILLRSKAEVEDGAQSAPGAARIFYIRRFLRILPVYLLTLFATAAIFPAVRRAFVWHLTYTTDFWVARHPGAYPVGVHFWTLAVEEQFYLMWPAIVLMVPRRYLPRVLLAAVLAAVACRGTLYGLRLQNHRILGLALPLVGNIDKFALGALLATFRSDNRPVARESLRRFNTIALWIGLPLLIGFELLHGFRPESRPGLAFTSTAAGLFFAWVIAGASIGFTGIAGVLLSWRPLVLMGEISYGLYLFHMFVPGLLRRGHVPMPDGLWPRFFCYAAVTLAMGTVSWFVFESPILRLKRKFRYTREREPVSAGAASADPVLTR